MPSKKVDLEKIKGFRKGSGITLEDMAERLGYRSPNGYYYLERGRSKFTAEMLAEVADILDLSLQELMLDVQTDQETNVDDVTKKR